MSDERTVAEGLNALCEVCERFVKVARDKDAGAGTASWWLACASLIREMFKRACAVYPDGAPIVIEAPKPGGQTVVVVTREALDCAAATMFVMSVGDTGFRSMTFNELPEDQKQRWRDEATAVIAAAHGTIEVAKAVGYYSTAQGAERPFIQVDGEETWPDLQDGDRIALLEAQK